MNEAGYRKYVRMRSLQEKFIKAMHVESPAVRPILMRAIASLDVYFNQIPEGERHEYRLRYENEAFPDNELTELPHDMKTL